MLTVPDRFFFRLINIQKYFAYPKIRVCKVTKHYLSIYYKINVFIVTKSGKNSFATLSLHAAFPLLYSAFRFKGWSCTDRLKTDRLKTPHAKPNRMTSRQLSYAKQRIPRQITRPDQHRNGKDSPARRSGRRFSDPRICRPPSGAGSAPAIAPTEATSRPGNRH